MKNFTLSLAFLYSLSGFAQEEFINTDFGTGGYLCISDAPQANQMGDMIKIGDYFYGLTAHTEYFLVKFDNTGLLDTEFGNDGIAGTGVYSGSGDIFDNSNAFIKRTADNNLLLVVDTDMDTSTNFMAKLDLNGNPVTSFGDGGYVNPFMEYIMELQSVDITEDEIIVVANNLSYFEPETFLVIVKYDLDGNLITSFGDNGILRHDLALDHFAMAAQYHEAANAVYSMHYTPDDVVYILKIDLSTGLPDNDFGTNGIFILEDNNTGGSTHDVFYVDEDENLYIAGGDFQGSNGLLFIKKYNSSLEPDTTFGTQGLIQEYVGPNNSIERVFDMDINQNGIILTGYTYEWDPPFNYERTFITKMNANGSLDTEFGENGSIINTLFTSVNAPYKTIEENGIFTIATTSRACMPSESPTVIQFNSNGPLTVNNFDNSALTLYPNPFKDTISLDNTTNIIGVELYDISGKLLGTFNKPESTLNLSYLQQGVYLVKVTTEAGVSNQKIVKQ